MTSLFGSVKYTCGPKKPATYFSKILRCCLFRKNHNIACNKSCTRPLHLPPHYCQSVSVSRGSYISRLSVWLPRTSQMTVAFCRTLVVAHCGPIPMTFGSCLFHEHVTNSVIGVSQPPVLDCGTTFHLDSGGWDLPSTLSDNL